MVEWSASAPSDSQLADMRSFLAAHPPFSLLPEAAREALPAQMRTLQAPRESVVLAAGAFVQGLYIVRSGRIAIRGTGGDIWAERREGETFGVRALLSDAASAFDAIALEDSVLYLLPDLIFARLHAEYPEFERFFAPLGGASRRLSSADERRTADIQSNLIALRVRDLMTRDPITVDPEQPIHDAAALMRDRRISSVPVLAADRLVGIITNADLRDRVVAERLPPETPVEAVMTPEPVTLDADRLAYDALLAMRRRTVRHLPVMQDGRLVGMLTNSDMLRRRIDDLGYFGTAILDRQTPTSLAQVVAQVPQMLVTLVETGVSAHFIGLTITGVADVTSYRLLQLAEERLGPPPVPYVWLSSGSQARQEQTGITDQDNCMILDDRYEEAAHHGYFKELAEFVCNGLHACGYDFCPGQMMAITEKWRQPLARWIRYFSAWIEEPEPTAQLLSSVLFDLRPIRGDTSLFDRLQDMTAARARANSMFVAHMATNALTHTPPLGFFREFVLIRGGEHDNRLDLKMQGTVPIIDLARVYALQAGIRSANTHDRLVEAHAAGVLSDTGMHDLINALEFLSMVRLKHQSRHIQQGAAPDNYLSPADLSRIERHHLRDAFLIIRRMQSNLANALQLRR